MMMPNFFNNPNNNNSINHQQQPVNSVTSSPAPPAAAAAAVIANPEERFANQLSQLESMGFTNKQENIRMLTITNGNVQLAIERLLSSS